MKIKVFVCSLGLIIYRSYRRNQTDFRWGLRCFIWELLDLIKYDRYNRNELKRCQTNPHVISDLFCCLLFFSLNTFQQPCPQIWRPAWKPSSRCSTVTPPKRVTVPPSTAGSSDCWWRTSWPTSSRWGTTLRLITRWCTPFTPLFYNLFICYYYCPQSQKDPAAVDKIMKDLDANGDGQVDFEEFVSLVVGLSIACEQCYQMHLKKTGATK